MKKTDLVKFSELVEQGCSKKEVIDTMNIANATYYNLMKTIKNNAQNIENTPLFRGYFSAVTQYEFGDKKDMAEYLGISKPTLIEFEDKGALLLVVKYLLLLGYSTKEIAEKTRCRESRIIDIVDSLDDVVSLNSINHQLRESIKTLRPISIFDLNSSLLLKSVEKIIRQIGKMTD